MSKYLFAGCKAILFDFALPWRPAGCRPDSRQDHKPDRADGTPAMKAGIIAAGRGYRLDRGGIDISKPLVPIAGEPVIARVIRAASELKFTFSASIVDDFQPEVANFIRSGSWPAPVELTVKTTPLLQSMVKGGREFRSLKECVSGGDRTRGMA